MFKIHSFRVTLGLITGLIPGCSSQKAPLSSVAPEDVEAIEIRTVPHLEPAAQTVSSADTAAIRSLLSVVNSAELTQDHKCANTMEIVLKQKGKNDTTLYVLRGHDSKYCELRFEGKIYRVDRAEFDSALTELGASELLDSSSSEGSSQ